MVTTLEKTDLAFVYTKASTATRVPSSEIVCEIVLDALEDGTVTINDESLGDFLDLTLGASVCTEKAPRPATHRCRSRQPSQRRSHTQGARVPPTQAVSRSSEDEPSLGEASGDSDSFSGSDAELERSAESADDAERPTCADEDQPSADDDGGVVLKERGPLTNCHYMLRPKATYLAPA